MRRGLIAWSKEELPPAAIEARCARLQAAMRTAGLDAVLVHTCFPRPAAVSWLTNFVPYWSEALLIVQPDGMPLMLASLSKRVHEWIREVSHMGEIIAAPHLGRATADLLARTFAGRTPRIGVVELGHFSQSHAAPIRARLGEGVLEDASDLFASVRQPADAAEIALAGKAVVIAAAALAAAPLGAATIPALAAPVETAARTGGAEECLILVAPDLTVGTALRRVEGESALGARFAMQASVAYKTAWVRIARSVASGPAPASWRAADRWFDALLPTLGADDLAGWPRHAPEPPGTLAAWTVESCTGAAPLSVAAADGWIVRPLTPGSIAVLTVRLETADGPWLRAAPLVLGEATGTGRALAPGA
jgi:hypothetical protein